MRSSRMVPGTALSSTDQDYVLRAYVHRYTQEHVPAWAKKSKPDGTPYRPQYRTDAEWLTNTRFAVRDDGRLDMRVTHCESSGETWPEGK